jgi:hypothetical protein
LGVNYATTLSSDRVEGEILSKQTIAGGQRLATGIPVFPLME